MLATAVEAILGALFEDSGGNLTVVEKGMASLGLIDDAAMNDAIAPTAEALREALREARKGALH